ncbi:MAG TPA: ribosome-associated translation inhibitor RaiA [Candidatus Paceibacterota bacterium]|nr:ribosome-associated translation inhibitor RaiA [Candidatus Paceibacterota bacterium]
MKIIIKTTKFELTESLTEYINKRFSPLNKLVNSFEKNGELILKIELALSTKHHNKGDVYYVECTLPIAKTIIRIEEYEEDMHESIDLAQKRLKLKIEELKEKVQKKNRGENVK